MGLLQWAIPLFLGLLLLEAAVARQRGRPVHRLLDSVTDIGCGILSQLTGIWLAVLAIQGYRLAGASWSLQQLVDVPDWPSGPVGWFTVFLLVDLGQYATHRLSHRVSFLWACHVVHHSSEELNLAVALRNTSLHGLFTWVFTLPGAMLGIPWQMFATCYALNVGYQFWLHTRLIGRLGPLELVFNTPSHHRVHHGRDAEYLDRNFGGVLIVWDRLCGTFAPERQEPDYGVSPRFESSNPVWANLHGWVEIGRAWGRATTWRGRLGAVFGPPDWPDSPAPAEDGLRDVLPVPLSYPLVQFLTVLGAVLVVVRRPDILGHPGTALLLIMAAWTLATVGGWLDGKRWVRQAEWLRLAALAFIGAVMAADGVPGLGLLVLTLAVGSGGWLAAGRPARTTAAETRI